MSSHAGTCRFGPRTDLAQANLDGGVFSVAFALLTIAVGLAAIRVLRLHREPLGLALAPAAGLALLPVLGAWGHALDSGASLSRGLIFAAGLSGMIIAVRLRQQLRLEPRVGVVMAGAIGMTALLLGLSIGRLEVPISNHDGVFHVETIDALRRGAIPPLWYPTGFHTTVAAALWLTPWLDSARATSEAGQGLALLAPLAVFAIARAFGLQPLTAAFAALIQSITFLFPYDFQVWGGWPLGMGVLLLLGLWSSALRWTEDPRLPWAILAGLLAGGILLTHGTEIYSATLGLLMIAVARRQAVLARRLAPHAIIGVAIGLIAAAPYLGTLVAWVTSGGASGVGLQELAFSIPRPDSEPRYAWIEYIVGPIGAASPLDGLARVALVVLGARQRQARPILALWAVFVGLVLVLDFLRLPVVEALYVQTFPWLTDHRPWQIAVIMASLLSAIGLAFGVQRLAALRPTLSTRPHAWRRLAIGCAIVAGFFAEGSAVSIYKRLANDIAENYLFSVDDGAAMAWLRQHARPGEVLANDGVVDAGIWAPYKANVPILLPRTAPGTLIHDRQPIVAQLLELDTLPHAEAEACALNVSYVYRGAREHRYDPRMLPARAELERDPDLEAVFQSGDAIVFRIRPPC